MLYFFFLSILKTFVEEVQILNLIDILDPNPGDLIKIGSDISEKLSDGIQYFSSDGQIDPPDRIYFFPEKTYFLDACATCCELPSNISTM